MSVQQKRLFIGGLNSGTSEKDIRERFKTFGSVSSVELHKVEKKEGFPEKTFAYIDIESSESNIRRCISMLTNTKWRGGILKIEPAKENFLTRLKKEREQVKSEKTKLASNQSPNTALPKEITEPVKNAVPGTPVNGQKNWVVGKFGRALPIVHMRPKHGNKVLKFDPSKTVHNLKRIKEEGEDTNVAQLTWNIESRGWYPWDTHKNSDKKHAIASSCSDESSDGDSEIDVKPIKKAKVSKKKEKNSNDGYRKGSHEDNSPNQTPQKLETDCNGNFKKRPKSEGMEYDSDSQENKSKRKRRSATNEECEINKSMFNELSNLTSSVQDVIDVQVTPEKKRKEKKKEKKKKEDLSRKIENGINDDIHNDLGETEKVKEKRKKKKGKDIDQEDDSSINETSCSQHDVTTENKNLKQKEKNKSKHDTQTLTQIDVPVDLESKHDERKLKRKENKKLKEQYKKYSECYTHDNETEEDDFKKENTNEVITCEESSNSDKNDEISTEGEDDNSKRNTLKQGRSVNDIVNNIVTGTDTDDIGKQIKTNTRTAPPKVKTTEKIPKEKGVSSINKKSSSQKKETSNQKRLQAIKEREMNTSTKQSMVSSALQNLDKKEKPENSKHITFDDDNKNDDDDNADEEEGKRGEKQTKHQVTGKVSGSKATNWLGLDSNSEDSSNDQIFDAKPQFEGKTGQKLFHLQKSYRGDSRFQLDKRFIDSDDDIEDDNTITVSKQNDDNTDVINVYDDDDDKVKKQLSQEKDMAMSVLRGILGENFGSKHDSSTRKHTFKNASLLRYDPTKDDHAQFEQDPTERDSSPEPSIKESQPTPVDDMRSNLPEVASDKFYDVKTHALTEMFSEKKKDEAPSTFTFLSNQDDDEEEEASPTVEWGEAEELKSKPWNPVMLPYDSSGDEQDDDDELPQQEDRSLPDEHFFFHFGDPELESRVYDQENAFMRTTTLEELNQHWVNVRSELTHDYKKKHKDAMRRNSKMAAKRARMR